MPNRIPHFYFQPNGFNIKKLFPRQMMVAKMKI